MKQAIILAAGGGSRLRAASNGTHKGLLKVGEQSFIEHQLKLLGSLNIGEVCVVVGHKADQVRSVIGDAAEYVINPRYAETNSLYSLWLAREWVSGPFVLMNCDVLAHPDIFHRVLAVNGSALAYDSTSGDEDEHMKVSFEGTYLRVMSKKLPHAETDGENVGILQFDQQAAELLFSEASSLIASGYEGQWVAAAVSHIARRVPIRGVDIAGLPWIEVDFPEDLARARQYVGPAILGCRDRSMMEGSRLPVGSSDPYGINPVTYN